MQGGVKVGDVMSRNFFSVSPSAKILDCAKIMIKKKTNFLFVVENKSFLGVLTERIIFWAMVKKPLKALEKVSARDLMNKMVASIRPSASLKEAFEKFVRKRTSLIVVLDNDNLLGYLSLEEIFKNEPEIFDMIFESEKINVEFKKRKGRISNFYGICEVCGKESYLFRDGVQSICEDCYKNR